MIKFEIYYALRLSSWFTDNNVS